MGTTNSHAVVRMANLLSAGKGVVCRYEWDSGKRSFRYRFFRYGRFIGSTGDACRVVKKMESFVAAAVAA